MYIAAGQGQTTPEDKILMSTDTSCHSGYLLQVSKNLFEVWFYTFFHDFIHVYSPREGANSPQGTKFWCQQKCFVTSFICCKFQQKSFWSLILYIFFFFFFFLIHVCSPGAGADSPQGTKFWCQQKGLITLPFVASFKEISLKSIFIQLFSWFNTCI